MEAPRAPHVDEFPSLRRLVNRVFMGAADTDMFACFPALFNEGNRENLLVCVDGEQVVSHVGMIRRHASLAGCTVSVGLIGAVATYAEYRGRGLAGRLFRLACDKAAQDGVDFLMISGDRPLYLAAGAAFVGADASAVVTPGAAQALADPSIRIDSVTPADLDACRMAYDAKPARFLRPLDDWHAFLDTRLCEGHPADWDLVRRKDVPCGYIVHRPSREPGTRRVVEWAGETTAVAAALTCLMERYEAARLEVHVQGADSVFYGLLRAAGVELRSKPASGTYLLLRFEALMARLRPWFEARLGLADAARLSFTQDGERFAVALGQERQEVHGRAEAARLVFGNPEGERRDGFLARAFPVPSLRYGLNYT